ncbi:MAG: hypothetical protein LBH16_06445 [Treponema sp.]|jgi:sulfite exporter TauE/SafE|nr:hypothetical protein [Treponema sp.]
MESLVLLGTAVSIALIHTVIGVDHYVPFIALSRANSWSLKKTICVVLLCGTGHVLGSVILGFAGITLAAGVTSLIDIEDKRGTIAAYALIAFGLIYAVYGISAAVRNKTHTHTGHDEAEHHLKKSGSVFWGLFIFFVLGPCEPLIPLLMYPAANMDFFTLVLVTVSFSVCTIAVMLIMTLLGLKGFELIKLSRLQRYAHAFAGSAILLCGVSVLALPI